ncbi:MAG: NAD-dependent epimerase/dehydratase family protein [Streptosporangiaceae bacterium]
MAGSLPADQLSRPAGGLEPGMNVLVTGATGLVGGAVAKALWTAGYQVTALVRSPRLAAHLPAADTNLVVGDMLRPETYRPLVRHVDAVVHAAQVRIPGRVTGTALASLDAADRVATETLASACAEWGRRLLYTSGCFGYGDHGDSWINEQTPLNPSPLGVSHARQVEYLRGRRQAGLDAVILHLGFVYGPGGNFADVFYDQARRNRLRCIGKGAGYWSCVHADDVGAAFVAALERAPAGSEYNIVDDTPLRLREFVDALTDAMARPRVGRLPTWLARLVVGEPAIASLTTSYRVGNEAARTELGWVPRFPSVHQGLPQVVTELEQRSLLPLDRA